MEVAYSEMLRDNVGARYPRRSVHPPNRLETRNWDILAAVPMLNGLNTLSALREFLGRLTGRKHIFFAPSCRAAIAQVLSLLPQQEVVMPAFTCPVVKTAVQVAGKRIIYVDTAPGQVNSTSVQFEQCAVPGRVLLPTHLFGIPTDIEAICELARDRGCVTIEDGAASLGVKYNGRHLGTFGDFSIFSFERSKRFPAFRGAAIVVNNEQVIDPGRLASLRLTETVRGLPIRDIAFALMYNAGTIPWIYGRLVLPRSLRKFAAWNPAMITDSPTEAIRSPFYTREFHPFQAALVLRMLSRLDRIRDQIRKLVSVYLDTLKNTSVVTLLPGNRDDAGLLRFPIALPRMNRALVLHLALQRGLFLETNYERILADEAPEGQFPNARWAARHLVLLPLYTALSPRNARELAEQVAAIGKQNEALKA